jgi:phosphoenolpyruvate carboxykinase (ATP)
MSLQVPDETRTTVARTARAVLDNPTQARLRELALEATPNVVRTATGSLNKVASIAKARSAGNTFVISDDPGAHTCKTISSGEAARIIAIQDRYIGENEMIRLDGWIGSDPERRVGVTLWISKEGANVAGMQQVMYFPVTEAERRDFRPRFEIVYTPGLSVEGFDRGRCILVDVDKYVTRIMGSDYFGESKKGGLRMLNAKVYREGGLMLHAGAKVTPVKGPDGRVDRRLILIMGESGTGKTTSTFSPQGNAEIGFSESIQDDFVMMYEGGRCYATENGCFAIAYGLREESEPIIYHGAMAATAWLENVYQDERGVLDFHKAALTPAEVEHWREALRLSGVSEADLAAYERGEKPYVWTKNARCIIPMSDIETAGDVRQLPAAAAIGVLNRNTNIIPAVVRFRTPAQAAAYFMLGETMGTAASGADAGKAKRSPFTNPFFPLRDEMQANRYMELAATMPNVFNFMMNTGWVGGDEDGEKQGRALKVKIRHSSAILQSLADGNVTWEVDPDFGYEVATAIPDVPVELLQPRRYYEQQNRRSEYEETVKRLTTERRSYLQGFAGLDPKIAGAI